ncbi:hypothetical protein [Marilutibacter aestuarii]|uniref:DUF998 domain-containing protein n=1 Tax=Marilutibacter aestuarii TaxID=1706195 RepID=A0A508AHN7_9GAMM|nr:hypothetical protein [Lysobacter aestuarii]TQD48947.1 hypothetical protein FKV25_04435 [Lysobacter aestuarii]
MRHDAGPGPKPRPPSGWLPLSCALLPFLAGHLALYLSIRDGWVAACLPHLEGCTSISRAARHGGGNGVFKALMGPAAVLQAVFWWRMAPWLHMRAGADPRPVAWLGLLATAFLLLYVAFLGSEGEVYRLLRRYGITVYFGGTFLALMQVLRGLARVRPRPAMAWPLQGVALGMLALGIASVVASAAVADPVARDHWENRLEWQLGLWLTAMFGVFAWACWRERSGGVVGAG